MRTNERERSPRRRHTKEGAHRNDVGSASGAVRGYARKYFPVQRRSRLFKTGPSSNDGGEVIGLSFANCSLLAAHRLLLLVDFRVVATTAQHSASGTFSGRNAGRGNAGLRFFARPWRSFQ